MLKLNPPRGIARSYISTFAKIFVLAALIIAAVQTPTFAANTERVEIVNGTGRTIVALESVALRNEWNGKDLLGGRVLNNGDSATINYDPAVRYFRLRIFFNDGKSITWGKIDFNDAWRLTLYKATNGKYTYAKNSRG